MDNGKKYAILGTTALVLVVAIRVGLIYRERHQDIKVPEAAAYTSDPDDLVFLKKLRPDSMKDVKELTGKTLWISAGGQMDYYPYTAHKVDYAKSQGVLLGVEPLVIKDAVEQVAPKSATFRIPGGDRQVLLVFTLPKSKDPAALFAVPIGDREGTTYTFQTDEIFFYEDPHVLYKHWTADQWKAIDEHRVIPGMNERQAELSLGQVSNSQSQDYGNRTVTFDHQGHPVDVTFEKNKATTIRPQS